MLVRRGAAAAAIAVAIGACVVSSSVASSDDSSDDSPEPQENDALIIDAVGDARDGVDIQSVALFNRPDLEFVSLAVTGRGFRPSKTRSVEIYLNTTPRSAKPDYRIIARNTESGNTAERVRMYRTKTWSTATQQRIECSELAVRFDIDQQSQIRAAVPRSCLNDASGKVSTNVSVWGKRPVRPVARPKPGRQADTAPDRNEWTRPK